MNLEELQRNRFARNFLRDRWLIAGTTGVVLLFSMLYLIFIHRTMYQSEAKVWIKDTSGSYLTQDQNESSYLRPLTTAGNPVATQSEILTSREMQDYLANYVTTEEARKSGRKIRPLRPEEKEDILKVRTGPNTDVIQVQVKWDNPTTARDMLRLALARFDAVNLDINRKIHTRKRAYIEQQLADLESKLVAVRGKIKDYQSGSMAVDVEAQTEELVRLRSQLVAQLESVMAARNNSSSSASALQRQLAMSHQEALNAVALGSGNETLVKMRSDLAALKQRAEHDSVKMAATNPALVALKKQIAALESQINAEVKQTVGGTGGKGLRIYDSVRSQLVQDLSSSRARVAGLGSEAATLSAAIARVDEGLRSIPESRFALANLQAEEKTLATAYDELRRKQIEASIKEAETPSNIFVVDAPNVPELPSFPTPLHVLVLSMLLGLSAGFGVSMFKTYSEDLAEGTDAVEEATRSRVLGVIPWLRFPMIQSPDSNVTSINDVAYRNIMSALRIECDKKQAEVIAFTSSSLAKPEISTSYQLAQRLARVGQSVALLDADFRPSSLLDLMPDLSRGMDLTDLILAMDLKLRQGQTVYPEEVMAGLMVDANGVHLGLNRRDVDNAYDYFASRGFRHLVHVLKDQFDWVFIDTPSAEIAPEFLAVSQVSDGVVLFADRKATFSTLRKIARKIHEAQVPLIGTVVREKSPQMERDHEVYTRWRDSWKNGGGGGGSLVPRTAGTLAVSGGRRIEFMGAPIDALTMQETVDRIAGIVDRREMVQHVVVNVAKLMTMRRDSELREIVNSSALVNADGAGVVLGARLLGMDIPERVPGIDLMQELVEMSNKRGYRLFFLGAEEHVVRDVITIYKRRYPNLQICGYRNGYFRPEDELAVAHQIRDARPDLLFVGMGSPRKEKFVRQYKEVMNVPFVMGVGGSFDVVAGKVERAPRWMQDVGMEWFYRLMQEPGRMWKRYLVTNAQYGWALAGQLTMRGLRAANG